jgi:oligopeptide/dipeptide ABC transporter ATP-binding protein
VNSPLLKLSNFSIVHKETNKTIVRDISFEVHENEVVGIIGESGSGKSLTMLSILGIIPDSLKTVGEMYFEGQKIEDPRDLRGKKISMIFQDPLTALNPVLKIIDQINLISKSNKMEYSSTLDEFKKLLISMKIQNPERVLKSFPHQLSGGMLQRVALALVLLLKPKLIIADEPTTSLDVTVQKEIIGIIKKIKTTEGKSIIFVTHDIMLAKELVDRIIVMYAGEIMEIGSTNNIIQSPLHPYTKLLIDSVPRVDSKPERLTFLQGRVPHFSEIANGCVFFNRCPIAEIGRCDISKPNTQRKYDNHLVKCFFA